MERLLFPLGMTLGSIWIAVIASTVPDANPFWHAFLVSSGAWIGMGIAAWRP